MLPKLLPILPILMLLSALPNLGCGGGTTVVRVPVPVVVEPPPCVRRPPPNAGESMDAAARSAYYLALTVYAWATWDACGPADHPMVRRPGGPAATP